MFRLIQCNAGPVDHATPKKAGLEPALERTQFMCSVVYESEGG